MRVRGILSNQNPIEAIYRQFNQQTNPLNPQQNVNRNQQAQRQQNTQNQQNRIAQQQQVQGTRIDLLI